jgi:two-component system response regulator CpxR
MSEPDRGLILVVDDHELSRRLISSVLGPFGLRVRGVGTLARARHFLAEVSPAAILLDLQLPDGSGLEFAADCRRNADLASCAILACTAGRSVDEERRAMDVGCDAYLTKPVDVHELPELLRSLLRSPGILTGPIRPAVLACAPDERAGASRSASARAGRP